MYIEYRSERFSCEPSILIKIINTIPVLWKNFFVNCIDDLTEIESIGRTVFYFSNILLL